MVESRWAMMIVVRPTISRSSACWISSSVSVSTDEVASSRIRIGASLSTALAIDRRCFCPPESFTPRSPIRVSYPSARASINPCGIGDPGGVDHSCSVASGRPNRMFSRTVPWNRNTSCKHDADLPAQAFQSELADILAIQGDAAGGRRHKSGGSS